MPMQRKSSLVTLAPEQMKMQGTWYDNHEQIDPAAVIGDVTSVPSLLVLYTLFSLSLISSSLSPLSLDWSSPFREVRQEV